MRLVGLAAVAALASGIPAASHAEEARKPAIGAVVPDFTARDVDGREFRLSTARAITAEQALSAVLAAAKAEGAIDPTGETTLDSIPGLKARSAGAPAIRDGFVAALGRPWGLLVHPEKTGRLSTLAEVAAWLETAATVPIVFLIWSPRCPYVKAYDNRIQSLVARAGARLYAVSSNARITADEVRGFVREHRTPYRVLVDPRQEVCDLLGGRSTPEAVVVDAKGVLRYRGGIDDDPLEDKKPEERAQWLCDAVTALVEGRDVARAEATAVGCPVQRK